MHKHLCWLFIKGNIIVIYYSLVLPSENFASKIVIKEALYPH